MATVNGAITIKQRIFDVLEGGGNFRVTVLVERILIALIVGNLIAVVLQTVPEYAMRWNRLFGCVETATVGLFAGEYALRLWVCDLHPPLRRAGSFGARLRYALWPQALVDLMSFGPTLVAWSFGIADFNVLVVFRLVRFLKLARYSPGMRSLVNAVISERRALVASLVLMVGMMLLAATAMYLLERNVQPEVFGSIPGAMYWAVTTLTTVGYGDAVPQTPAGKLLAGMTMMTGLGMFALPVGIIATAFAREIHNRDFVVTWGMVARVPIFADLDAATIAEVAKLLRAQTVEAGAVITQRDTPAFAMYFIASGVVEVDGPMGRVKLSEGAFFGEMAVLRRGRRTADVVAMSDCRLLVLDADDLHVLMSRRPKIGRHIRAVAAQRVKAGGVAVRGDILPDELAGGTPVDGHEAADEPEGEAKDAKKEGRT